MGSNVRITLAKSKVKKLLFFFLKNILSLKAFSLLQSQSSTDTYRERDADLT